ncbi:hypothetical protein Ciccas_010860, partial [Cichlidogyrus casuarinus]
RGFQWDEANKECLPENPCSRKDVNFCDPSGTIACVPQDDFTRTPTCLCVPGRSGSDCANPINACVKRVNWQVNSPGNDNCNVLKGNECVPILGVDKYFCKCKKPFQLDLSLNYDNCQAFQEACIEGEKYCENEAKCLTSLDGLVATCQCKKDSKGRNLFTGPFCSKRIGEWSNWVEIGSCEPATCGSPRFQRRRRVCISDPVVESVADCYGSKEQLLPCPSIPCQVASMQGSSLEQSMDSKLLTWYTLMSAVEIGALAAFWLIFGPVFSLLISRCISYLRNKIR